MGQFVVVFIQLFITALWLVVVGRVLLSWVNPTFSGPVARFLFETTEPLLAPIRRFMPSTGTVDWSPLILMLLLGVVMQLVLFR
ncbi:MAG TPA: YggT family protein [Candidatus Limnocylindrales bacterium]